MMIPLPASAQEPVAVFGTTVVIPSGLRGDIYYLPARTQMLADLPRYEMQGSIYTTRLNVPPQDFTRSFAGVTPRNEWFAIDDSGKFRIQKPGLYPFRLVSDAGADNDGTHSPQCDWPVFGGQWAAYHSRAVLSGTARHRGSDAGSSGAGRAAADS